MAEIKQISKEDVEALLLLNEGHFADLKGKAITPAKFTKAVSAFANAGGGEIYVGIEELEGVDGKERTWDGFDDPEAANAFFQVVHELDPLSKNFSMQFLQADGAKGLVLHVTVSKTQNITAASDGRIYIRSNASSLPVKDDALERLRYDKGIQTYEDELLGLDSVEITNSETIIEFLIETIPTGEPEDWLTKQFVLQQKNQQ
ncbi:ATP-binding protein [Aminobacter sp. DSM 101952]|uniref:AlbA family DNA-binding domain-containing protein n=1 Tax=Aminobacter sp. DSM 101952 TaxID=2735891 RepID=UPI00178F2A3E|nr:ATP-binding protein [Aminobacter sp. DSM 101952]